MNAVIESMTTKWFEGYARALNAGFEGIEAVEVTNAWFIELNKAVA